MAVLVLILIFVFLYFASKILIPFFTAILKLFALLSAISPFIIFMVLGAAIWEIINTLNREN
ncbi:hypothetical protein [Desulfurobacterium atlanticum]|uniref:Uncharacterized protein n=1 Tax=Desulfurobacterium atlanticum TaxID=240169 RepID=A0A238Y5R5_9BACT|nr:hypothetical protein [Desulfurobacterium atlanticum]SNR65993.1 hypothetical protein SAMN06265340_102106 [Desulfurobacterium atlanticum]